MEWMGSIVILLLTGALIYVCYTSGYITVNNKSALTYIGSASLVNRSFSATFSACNGTIKRVIRFREDREYTLRLECRLTKGSVQAILQDAKGGALLVLDENNEQGTVRPDPKGRYYLTMRFAKADGKYQFRWE